MSCYRPFYLLMQANAAYSETFGEKAELALPPAKHAAFLVRLAVKNSLQRRII